MHLALKTLLNRVEPLKGFVYESSRISTLAGGCRESLPTLGVLTPLELIDKIAALVPPRRIHRH